MCFFRSAFLAKNFSQESHFKFFWSILICVFTLWYSEEFSTRFTFSLTLINCLYVCLQIFRCSEGFSTIITFEFSLSLSNGVSWYVSSHSLIQWIIFHKIHICNIFNLNELSWCVYMYKIFMNYENYSQCGKRSVPNLIIGKKILKCMWKMSIKDFKRYKCEE